MCVCDVRQLPIFLCSYRGLNMGVQMYFNIVEQGELLQIHFRFLLSARLLLITVSMFVAVNLYSSILCVKNSS